ncbi:MAG TPA: TIGR03960 family B12-binding radical SAM protein [Patescibacteria group bacterium]|nr:TIGR03960 family B12-binding radical SAM protein [Patescibacteria group bacterium]
MSWELKEQLKQIRRQETGEPIFFTRGRSPMALAYPNSYHVGMSNLGLHIIYQQVNRRGDTACERFFLPDSRTRAEHRRTNTPLLSVETQQPLHQFPLIAFAVSFEMDYFNLLEMLELGRVPLLAAERDERHPLVIIGGPCATFNPEPLADFVDLCVVGEGEEVIHELLDTYYQGREQNLSRRELLLRLAALKGIYVPSFYQPVYSAEKRFSGMETLAAVPAKIERRWIRDLDRYPAEAVIFTENTEFKDMFLMEVARGCGRHCRFCMAGYCFRRPRNRSLDVLQQAVKRAGEFRKKVGLVGAAISDYPEINELCGWIRRQDMGLSVASLRADSLTPELVAALKDSGHRTLTLAPEAGSERMRRVINKGLDEQTLLRAVDMAMAAGIPHIRLYIMIGLPEERDEDLAAIVRLALTVKNRMRGSGGHGRLTLSVNPFIPKPFTPFQWSPMALQQEVTAKIKQLQHEFKQVKGIELLVESPREAYVQAVLARGDRRLGAVLKDAVAAGGVKGWKSAMKQQGLEAADYLYRFRTPDEMFPWEVLQPGVDRAYLWQEYQRAGEELFTEPCHSACHRCGVCH